MDPETLENAWIDPAYDEILQSNRRSAIQWGVAATPSYVFGDQPYTGAIPVHMMRHAVAKAGRQIQY